MTPHDYHGREIMAGDLLRTFQLRLTNQRKLYLYHVAVMRGERLRAVPLSEAIGGNPDGGDVILQDADHFGFEVIDGPTTFRPDGSMILWCERPKLKGIPQ